MSKTKLTLDRSLFDSLAPKSSRAMLFTPGDEIKLISIDPDKQLEWGNQSVPAMNIEVNGKPMEVPVSVILGAVVNKPGIIHNSDMGALECVDFLQNSLHDYLKATADDKDTEITLPESIKVVKRINKGIKKASIDQKKEVYEQSFLVEEGKTFDEQFADLEYIPTIFKSATGTLRTNGAYVIAELD